MTYPDRSDWSNPWDDKDDRYSPFTVAVMECLTDWFWALEAGVANQRLPRQDYPKTWTDAQLENLVSVANKKVQQPRYDQWHEGWQRCLENLALNFFVNQRSDAEKELAAKRSDQQFGETAVIHGDMGWAAN